MIKFWSPLFGTKYYGAKKLLAGFWKQACLLHVWVNATATKLSNNWYDSTVVSKKVKECHTPGGV